MKMKLTCTVNGTAVTADVPPETTLLAFLRKHLHLTGTKEGCGEGDCGACTVMVDGKTVNSCLMLALDAEGQEILTVEGLAKNGELDSLQRAFIEEGAVQCGFCTPGMLMSAKMILDKNCDPSEEEIKRALSGNLCRCTGYVRIVKAVKKAASMRLSAEKGVLSP